MGEAGYRRLIVVVETARKCDEYQSLRLSYPEERRRNQRSRLERQAHSDNRRLKLLSLDSRNVRVF